MRYKVLKGTETYNKLLVFSDKITAANQAAVNLVKELGATQYCGANSPFILYGGISGIKFPEKPAGWKLAFPKEYADTYYPNKNNTSALAKIEALPLVEADELNSIVGYEDQQINVPGKKSIWSPHPGYCHRNGEFLLVINDDAVFNHSSDIVEITLKEYKELSEIKEPAKEV